MDMRKRVRCMMSECFHRCQPAPSRRFLPWHRVITSGTLGGESQNQLPFFLVGEWSPKNKQWRSASVCISGHPMMPLPGPSSSPSHLCWTVGGGASKDRCRVFLSLRFPGMQFLEKGTSFPVLPRGLQETNLAQGWL